MGVGPDRVVVGGISVAVGGAGVRVGRHAVMLGVCIISAGTAPHPDKHINMRGMTATSKTDFRIDIHLFLSLFTDHRPHVIYLPGEIRVRSAVHTSKRIGRMRLGFFTLPKVPKSSDGSSSLPKCS